MDSDEEFLRVVEKLGDIYAQNLVTAIISGNYLKVLFWRVKIQHLVNLTRNRGLPLTIERQDA